MKLQAETGPRTWMLPLWGEEDTVEVSATRWWESDRLVLVTSLQRGDMVHLCFYDRDDDCEWPERPPDLRPLGIDAGIHHEVEGEDYVRAFTLTKVVGVPVARVPDLTQTLGDVYEWASSPSSGEAVMIAKLALENRGVGDRPTGTQRQGAKSARELVRLAEDLEG